MNSAEPDGPRGFTVPRSHVTLAHNFITLLGPLFRSGNQNIWAQMKQNESFAEVIVLANNTNTDQRDARYEKNIFQ